MTATTPPLAGALDLPHLSDIEHPMQHASPDQPDLPPLPQAFNATKGGTLVYSEDQMYAYAMDAVHARWQAEVDAPVAQSVSVPEPTRLLTKLHEFANEIDPARGEWDRGYEAARAHVKVMLAAAPLPQPQADAHPLDGVHINQGSMDAAADQYERDYAAGARLPGRATIRKALADAAAQQGEGSIDSEKALFEEWAKNHEFKNSWTQSAYAAWQERARLARTAAPSEPPVLSAAKHAIHNLKEYRAGHMPFPGEAINILERFVEASSSAPIEGQGVFSEFNACMHRETCRAALAKKGQP